MKDLKILSYLVGVLVVGIVTCFGMSVYTAVKEHQAVSNEASKPIIVPATQ